MAQTAGHINIEIKNWDRFTTRRDIKASSWFRLNNSFWVDPQFFEFDSDDKMVWIGLLCQASIRQSAQISISVPQMAALLRIKTDKVQSAIEKLCDIGCVRVRDVDVTYLESFEHATDRQTDSNSVLLTQHDRTVFDFESLYAKYPKRPPGKNMGKATGMKSCAKKIKTQKAFDELASAVDAFASEVESGREDREFIPMWSSFVNKYKDYLPENNETQREPIYEEF